MLTSVVAAGDHLDGISGEEGSRERLLRGGEERMSEVLVVEILPNGGRSLENCRPGMCVH